MAINEKARNHYDEAVSWHQSAQEDAKNGEVNQAVVATGIADTAIGLARFCVENHALVRGIDDEAQIDPKSPVGGAKLWRGPSP
jgi:hypothetical protein